MRTLTEEICWIISPDRKYPLSINNPRFYNPLIGHFYTDNSKAEYDEEEVSLVRCEFVRKSFRPVGKQRVLAPYALCANDYEGCRLCNRHIDFIGEKCPFVLSDDKVYLTSGDSVIGFYKCFEGIYYERKSYNKLMLSLGIPEKYLTFKPKDDRISTAMSAHDLIMAQGQTCDIEIFKIMIKNLGRPSHKLLRYIFSDETVHFSEKMLLLTRTMTVSDLEKVIINFDDNPRIQRILQRIRQRRLMC